MVGPQEHAARVIVLLTGRVQPYEPTPSGQSLTVSVTESGTGWSRWGLLGTPAGAARACTFCSYSNAKTAGSISLHQKGQGVTPRPFVRSRPYSRDR